jgi:hypothetical protein
VGATVVAVGAIVVVVGATEVVGATVLVAGAMHCWSSQLVQAQLCCVDEACCTRKS